MGDGGGRGSLLDRLPVFSRWICSIQRQNTLRCLLLCPCFSDSRRSRVIRGPNGYLEISPEQHCFEFLGSAPNPFFFHGGSSVLPLPTSSLISLVAFLTAIMPTTRVYHPHQRRRETSTQPSSLPQHGAVHTFSYTSPAEVLYHSFLCTYFVGTHQGFSVSPTAERLGFSFFWHEGSQ